MTKTMQKAAEDYAKNILGEKQFKNNKNAVESVKTDFIAGVQWYIESEERTEKNTGVVAKFCQHFKSKTNKEIPDEIFESFFNA